MKATVTPSGVVLLPESEAESGQLRELAACGVAEGIIDTTQAFLPFPRCGCGLGRSADIHDVGARYSGARPHPYWVPRR